MWQSIVTAALFHFLHPVPAQTAAAKPLSAAGIVSKVQGYYQSTTKLQAKFRQEYTNTTFGKTSISDGTVYIAKPGKMRWDYKKPEEKFFISDGTTLWVYEKEQKQVFQQSLKDQILPVAITFLYGKGDSAAKLDPALDPGKFGGKGDLVVKLTPKVSSAQYKNLWLVVDPADFHVKESIILEASDNLNHFTFYDIKLNKAANFEDKHFHFVPPSGVRVIKGDSPTQGTPGE